jgi:tRNA (adenine37-N6)-methyltransferase
VTSCYKDKFAVPRQSGLVAQTISSLVIQPQFQPEESLKGLEGFSHMWIIWIFHENNVARFHAKVHPPRLGGEPMGLFATRTPHRPNPIGLSLVKIEKIEGSTIWFSGSDLMEGTPVLDIKPYLPAADFVENAKVGWTENAERPLLHVVWSLEASRDLEACKLRQPEIAWSEIITRVVELDPRPEIYRQGEPHHGWKRRLNHAFRIYDVDVHFCMVTNEQAEISQILFMHNEIRPANLRKAVASITSS